MFVSQVDFDVVMYINVWVLMGVLFVVLLMVEVGCNGVDEFGGVFVVIFSCMGSIGDMIGNGGWLYCVSKVVVNVVLCGVFIDVKNVMCLIFYFGWVQIDMGGVGVVIMVQESVVGICCVIVGVVCVDNGGFCNYDGSVIEW